MQMKEWRKEGKGGRYEGRKVKDERRECGMMERKKGGEGSRT